MEPNLCEHNVRLATDPTMSSSANLGLWLDESNALEWASACRGEITLWFAGLAGNDAVSDSLTVMVEPPTQEQAAAAFSGNRNLTGQVKLSWQDQEIGLTLPMPFNGAFLSTRPGLQKGLMSVWGSWLGEAQGFRRIRSADEVEAGRNSSRWRLGLPGGRQFEASATNLLEDKAAFDRLAARLPRLYFGDRNSYPEHVRPHLALFGLSSGVEDFLDAVNALLPNSNETAEDDLDHRVLVTFPVWLKHQISREMLNAVLKPRKADSNAVALGNSIREVLTGRKPGSEETARAAWAIIQNRGQRVANRVEWAINGHTSDDSTDYVDPINPLDLVSRITRVRRIPAARQKLAFIGAARRQNLPSFQGKLCPLESPESELVGLSLQLASGASVDFAGKIHPASDPAGELGFGARLIPFLAHNDGTRNMMGAKNLRQAVPLRKRQSPKVRTGGEALVESFAGPLTGIGLCPDAKTGEAGFGLGRDLLVAYLPWRGMNFEDAMVIGEHVLKEGWLDLSFTQSIRKSIKRGWVPTDPVEPTVLSWSQEGLARVGTELFGGSPIAHFVWEGKGDEKPLVIQHAARTPAILQRVRFSRKSEWTSGVLEYDLEMPIPPKPGDKLMGRHGNKGVIGAILPMSEMPRLPDSENIPQPLRGKPIDILLNPHGVISRMNLGQLIETHLGWLLHGGFSEADFRKDGTNGSLATPFGDTVDHDKVQSLLEKSGLDRHGRIRLLLPDGAETASPVVVGFQHIVRLRHIPEMKSQARRGDKSALYAARTGQAVRGRKQGGGQRIGEMEMWALAAHQAETVISEMQGIKSSAELVAQTADPDLVEVGYTGYRRLLENWLFAMLIKLDIGPDEVRFGFVSEKEILDRAGSKAKVTSPAGLAVAPTARFRCLQGGERKPCACWLLDGEKIAFPSTSGDQDAKSPPLCLGDLLAHFDLRVSGPLAHIGTNYEIPLLDLRTGKSVNPLLIKLESAGGKAIKGTITVESRNAPSRWPETLPSLSLYGQFPMGAGRSWSATDLIAEFMKSPEAKREERRNGTRGSRMSDRAIEEMRISCPEHSSKPLAGTKPFAQCRRGEPGGLFDPLIFGSGMPKSMDAKADRWGVIDLPFEVPYPKEAFGTFRDPKDAGTATCPSVKFVPVLPTRFRPPGKWQGDLVADPIDRLGYAPLVELCRRYAERVEKVKASLKENSEQKDLTPEQAEVEKKLRAEFTKPVAEQVGKLFKLLANALEEKTGLIRQDGLGRRVDRSARLVVTPNPELQWDSAGIPVIVLLELMGDLLGKWLDRLPAKKRAALPELKPVSWLRPRDNPQAVQDGVKILEAYLKEHKEFVILLNRQPSLHRDSIQAFHPVPLPPEAGEVIQLCPLACKGFGADFDGDEMVVHLPLSIFAQIEARALLPSRNLFSLASEAPDNVLAHFDQDFVMGTWLFGKADPVKLRETFLSSLPEGEAGKGGVQEVAAAWGSRPSKNDGLRLLAEIAEKHMGEEAAGIIWAWMHTAFEACTRAGISFGYYELREIANQIAGEVAGKRGLEPEKVNKALGEIADEYLDGLIAEDSKLELAKPGTGFAAMARSGARGGKQVRQMVAARGLLDPGATAFQHHLKDFVFRRSLVEGLTPAEAFNAAMNARSSMCDKKIGTAYAGGLTRSLVFALWDYRIASEDCGNGEGANPATCKVEHGFCSKCYGPLPSGEFPCIGFPAGLIAAQSIGERGTQLSMQSFHGGEQAMNIHWVRFVLGLGKPPVGVKENPFAFAHPDQAPNFVSKMKGIKAYEDLLDVHFQILWRRLHDLRGAYKVATAIKQSDPITKLSYRNPVGEILTAAVRNERLLRNNPFAGVLFGAATKSNFPAS